MKIVAGRFGIQRIFETARLFSWVGGSSLKAELQQLEFTLQRAAEPCQCESLIHVVFPTGGFFAVEPQRKAFRTAAGLYEFVERCSARGEAARGERGM